MATCQTTKEICITYSKPARDCVRQLRVFPPAQRGLQRVINLDWQCLPETCAVQESSDDFGNRVLELRHANIEREFRFSMQLTTHRESYTVGHHEGLSDTGMGAFLLPSALCDLSDAVCQQAQLFKSEQADNSSKWLIARICEWTYHALQYTPGVTGAMTTAGQALGRGAGVCQDYTHLMIALCRALSLPARYISGYNLAEGLMHAWVEVLCDGQWQAWDPTHNRPTAPQCVFVACGRDFRDVEPLIGTYRGCGTARLSVRCHTQVIN